jgi:hypothetical protein
VVVHNDVLPFREAIAEIEFPAEDFRCFGLAWFRIYVEVPKMQRRWRAVDR